MKLIDKDAVLIIIEKLIDEIYDGRPFDFLSSEQQTALWYVKSIMSSIILLEVKEVDLEEEIERVRKTHFINDDFEKATLEGRQITNIAKHFFELGLKAQKGKKV